MLKILAFVAAVAASLPSAFAQSALLQSFSFAGSGCAPGEATADLLPDSGLPTRLSAHFSDFVVSSEPPGVPVGLRMKNCNMAALIRASEGYQFRISAVKVSGMARISAGMTGQVRMAMQMPSPGTETELLQATITGPFNGPFSRSMSTPTTSWSRCGGEPLLVKSQLRLNGPHVPNDKSFLGANPQGNEDLEQVFRLQWRACP